MDALFLLAHLLVVALMGGGAALVLVEKRFDYPVRGVNLRLRRLLRRWFSHRFSRVTQCAVCASFWLTLLAEVWVWVATGHWAAWGLPVLWPLSGLSTAGLVWLAYEAMKAVESGRRVHVEVTLTPPQPADERLSMPGGERP